jgi:hypothetical protein
MRPARALIWHDAPYIWLPDIWLPVPDIISATRTGVAGVEVSPTGTTLLRHAAA